MDVTIFIFFYQYVTPNGVIISWETTRDRPYGQINSSDVFPDNYELNHTVETDIKIGHGWQSSGTIGYRGLL